MIRHDCTPGPRGATPYREALDERKSIPVPTPAPDWLRGATDRVAVPGAERQGAK